MQEKNDSMVIIDNTVYTLSGYESQEYMQKVANFVNEKIKEIQQSDNSKKMHTRLQSVLVMINLADEYMKLKMSNDEYLQKIQKLEESIASYKKELDEYMELFEQGSNE
ncbi:MAG: cell division protein ZapA [Vallitaleaceae bacterium]|jgi:cell division protein ZapA|nr:cell division protein ZapA [Vallitaleaceae bacterium]